MIELAKAWLFWFGVLAIVGVIIFGIEQARAFDHGFNHNDELVQWFASLHRKDLFPCCGLGDAYAVTIEEEPTPGGIDDDGVAIVTDNGAKKFPDGSERVAIPYGTVIHFSDAKVTAEKYGNPTSTAWAFLQVYRRDGAGIGTVDGVYCVVPLPAGF